MFVFNKHTEKNSLLECDLDRLSGDSPVASMSRLCRIGLPPELQTSVIFVSMNFIHVSCRYIEVNINSLEEYFNIVSTLYSKQSFSECIFQQRRHSWVNTTAIPLRAAE